MDPTHKWNLYTKVLRIDIHDEDMHEFDEEKYYSRAEHRLNVSLLLSRLEIFENIFLKNLKDAGINEESRGYEEAKKVFVRVKGEAYNNFEEDIEYSVFILFSVVEVFSDKMSNFKEKSKKWLKELIKEINSRFANIIQSLDNGQIDQKFYEVKYDIIRTYLAKDHRNFLDKKFNEDKSALEEIRSNIRTHYFFITLVADKGLEEYLRKWKLMDDKGMPY